MKVLVCGGRRFNNQASVNAVLDALPVTTVIHGGARGADTCAANWAATHTTVGTESFPADWEKHGRSAGIIRNAQMLKEGQPDLVVAFTGGRGTADMVRRAKGAGVRVLGVEEPDTKQILDEVFAHVFKE